MKKFACLVVCFVGLLPLPILAAKDEHKAGDRMTLTIKDVEYAFRWCPPGTFTMGSPASEEGRFDNETQHQVTLTRGFWMLETEVTQNMWESVMGNNPSQFKGVKLPVERVTWEDCQKFIEQLNTILTGTPVPDLAGTPGTDFKFSLPTEAQWEYACRAGTTTAYHFGNSLSADQANFDGDRTKEVGSYPANAWGLFDMHGNVWERCSDLYGNYPDGAVTDPTGPDRGWARHAVRGGGWGVRSVGLCRSAYRHWHGTGRGLNLGVRLALVHAE